MGLVNPILRKVTRPVITPIKGISGSTYWNTQKIADTFLFYGETSKITGGKLYNQVKGSSDWLTVAGSAGSETYQAPDNATYQTADTDYIWFKTDATQRTVTTAELIGYDLQRSPVKYDDNSPNTIRKIGILKSGKVLTATELNHLFDFFTLPLEWHNDTNPYGHIKDNRVGQNLWIPESVYEEELNTYITGLTTPLSTGQKNNLNTLVVDLKTATGVTVLSDAFDYIRILAGETSESSLKNLVKNAHHGTLHGATPPSFAQFEGFTGDGSTGYIDSHYNTLTEKSAMAQDNISMFVYSRTNVSANQTEIGNVGATDGTYLMYRYTNAIYHALNSGSGARGTVCNPTTGLLFGTRVNGTKEEYTLNGTLHDDLTVSSKAPLSLNIYECATNNLGTAIQFSTKQLAITGVGRGFTLQERIDITTAFEKYMDANGKGVIA